MPRTLPNRPNLRHLGHQARDLVRAHAAGDVAAAERIGAFLPRLSGARAERILSESLSLQEAQHVIAREYGFAQWTQLCEFVRARQLPRGMDALDEPTRAAMERAMAASRSAAMERSLATSAPVVEVKSDVDLGTPAWELRVNGTRAARLWRNPEEREHGNDWLIDTNYSQRRRPDAGEPEGGAVAGDWIDGAHYAALQRIHVDFCGRASRTLSAAAGTAVEAALFGVGQTEYAEFVSGSDVVGGEVCRFGLGTGGRGLLVLTEPTVFSLVGRPLPEGEAAAELSAEERRRADAAVVRLLRDLARSCGPRLPVRPEAVEHRVDPRSQPVAEFAERVVCAQLVVQSVLASQAVTLAYPRSAVEPRLAELIAP